MSIAPEQVGICITRHFTSPETHPYDDVVWERRDARISNYRDGSVAFEQLDVEFPVGWSLNATNIVAQKYFRGTLGTPEREHSLRQVVDRVTDTIAEWGIEAGYFVDDAESEAWAELKLILITQRAAFNSPVWFNIGVKGVPQQASACFILAVDDTMDSILNWYREEGTIFKGGSGAGINLSAIRSSKELLQGGGTASGPVSFMRGADASAGTIKSGGKTRRAAKMVILNADHPDIEEFIWCKVKEERKARVLRDGGFDMDLDGADSFSIQYQNANNSVRVTDDFMQAVLDDADWNLIAVKDGSVVQTMRARDLWRQIAQASWECADPGLQFDTTINRWHTAQNTGRMRLMPSMEEILLVSSNGETYKWVCTELMKCVVGYKMWTRRHYKETLSEIATCSDEAFLLLTLENNYAKWNDEWLWQLENRDKDKDQQSQKNWAESLYTSSESRAKRRSRRFQGWSREGYIRFNSLYAIVLQDRKRRANFEAELKASFALKETRHSVDSDEEDDLQDIFPANDMAGMQSSSASAVITPAKGLAAGQTQTRADDENSSSSNSHSSSDEDNDL